ncbi:MAG: transglutaminase domain-containing protein [Oscillibacter sp.]|jgi:precorrin isomerase|nr:transglutaminase domain-containing protein [Oscillibacter sp.]
MKALLKRLIPGVLALTMLAGMLSGCGQSTESVETSQDAAYMDSVTLENTQIEEEAVALSAQPAISTDLMPVASGTLVKKNEKAVIDYSNTADGYVMANYTASTTKKLKVQVKGPSGTTYTYDLTVGVWTTYPLSDGNGGYKVTVYENTSGTKYATVLSVSFSVALSDQFAPFLRPNQYVNYESNAVHTVAKAQELCAGLTAPLDKVKAVYNYVVKNITYDKAKAASVQSGYLPVLDTVLAAKKGICFDYAAVMTAMLRSQGVPCKLVVGYAGTAYHAWISVWSEKDGWVDAAIYFDGDTWQRMDPTFASSGKESSSIMKYIGDGSHYTAKYLY